jgi:hypothetical protein
MARSSQRGLDLENQDPSLTPSQPLQTDPVSLVGPPAQVEQWGPTPDMVIGHVEPSRAMEPDPTPVVTFGDDRTITIN